MVTALPLKSAVAKFASVNGVPVCKAGMASTSGLNRSKSSSSLLFLLASKSVSTTKKSSPEFHSASAGTISMAPKPKTTKMVVGTSL